MGVCMYGLCNVCVCVCMGYLVSACVYVWVFNVWVCVFMGYVLCGCV